MAEQTIKLLRQYTDRKIVVRPHPRSPISVSLPNVVMELPKLVPGSYDDFDINYHYHCVINHNSGPAVQAAIKGIPIICDSTSLAAPVSNTVSDIENLQFPNRDDWFLKLCHTEWTVDEIIKGIPLQRLQLKIS